MKKIISSLLVLLLLAGCSSGKDSSTETITFTRGIVENNTYTNKTMNITIDIPDTFVVFDDKQLVQLMQSATDVIETGENIDEAIAKQVVTPDFGMADPVTSSSIIVTVENLTLEKGAEFINSEEDYLDYVVASLNSLETFNYETNKDYFKKTIGNTEWLCNEYDELNSGLKQMIMVKKANNLIYIINLTALKENTDINTLVDLIK